MSVSGISRASQHSGPGILPDKYSYYLQSMRSSHGDLGRVGVLGGAPLVGGSAGGGQLRYASPLWPGQGEPQDRLASQKPAADAKLSPSKVLGISSLFSGAHYRGSRASNEYEAGNNLGASSSYFREGGRTSMHQMLQLQQQQSQQLQYEQDLQRSNSAALTQAYSQIRDSKAETERLRNLLSQMGSGPAVEMQDEYRSYRRLMGDREESYRRKWRGEESRVQAVAEETKSRLKIVRDHLIATLDNVDVSNRTMMDTMDELMKVDRDMAGKYGDVLPNSGAAVPAPQ